MCSETSTSSTSNPPNPSLPCQPHLILLPAELRQQILTYLLPSEPVIQYKCPGGAVSFNESPPPTPSSKSTAIFTKPVVKSVPSNHSHQFCGWGLRWSCRRPHFSRNMSIMRTCQILYQDCVEILYGRRIFEVEIGGMNMSRGVALWVGNLDLVFTEAADGQWPKGGETVRRIERMNWHIMRGIRLVIEVNWSEGIAIKRALSWFCTKLASITRDVGLKRVEVWLHFRRGHESWEPFEKPEDLTKFLSPIQALEGTVQRWGVGEMLNPEEWSTEFGKARWGWKIRIKKKQNYRYRPRLLENQDVEVAGPKRDAESGKPFIVENVQEELWRLLREEEERWMSENDLQKTHK